MKKVILKIAGLIMICFSSSAQSTVNYGSNNGKYVTVKNTKIYYEEYGSGTPLLLLHGGLASLSTFSNVIPDLQKHFRVIAVDGPGEGRSEMPGSVSFKLEADYASEFIDKLKLDSVYVWGFSLGATTALQLAVNRPDKIKMAVVHAGIYNRSGYNDEFGGDKVTTEVMEKYPNIWLNDHLKKSPQAKDWKKYLTAFLKIWDDKEVLSEAQLKSIAPTTLIVQGDGDMIKNEHALKMHQLIPKSHLAILPNSNHFIIWERPDLISKIVLDFFLRKKPVGQFGM